MRRIQELKLGLTNIAYRQVIHVTNPVPGASPATDLARATPIPAAPAPPLAVAVPH